MSRLIRMDSTGHSTLAQWTTAEDPAFDAALTAFRRELDLGYIAVVDQGEGRAEQVTELPSEGLVIMRRPIAGG